jgi:hypothetical protein
VKTLLNNLWAHLSYEDDGHLVHTDKRSGAKRTSLETWPDGASAKEAVAVKLSKIEWDASAGVLYARAGLRTSVHASTVTAAPTFWIMHGPDPAPNNSRRLPTGLCSPPLVGV